MFQDMFQDEDAVNTAVLSLEAVKTAVLGFWVARNTCRRSFDEPLLNSILDIISSKDLITGSSSSTFVLHDLLNME